MSTELKKLYWTNRKKAIKCIRLSLYVMVIGSMIAVIGAMINPNANETNQGILLLSLMVGGMISMLGDGLHSAVNPYFRCTCKHGLYQHEKEDGTPREKCKRCNCTNYQPKGLAK